jgi:S1-C subfamily serine protease
MNKKVSLSLLSFVLMTALLACQASSLLPTNPAPVALTPTTSSVQPVAVKLVNQEDELIALYQAVSPGVVSIKTTTAQGSGWVYSSDGYIVTNQHVVGTETKVEVDFIDGTKVYGTVVGTDANSDLAVIKVDVPAAQLHPLPLGDSDTVQVGQIVIAIGNPFGYSGTMTSGIVSALGRALPSNNQSTAGGFYSLGDLIQTDAPLNPGNSGGPLLNLSGQVIGVNRAIETNTYTTSGEPVNSGIGFSISVNTIKRVVPSLIQNGKFSYPLLGVSAIDDLPLSLIDALGLKSTTGAYVTSVTPGGPADKAGLKAGTTPLTVQGYTDVNSGGDLIIAMDGQQVFTFDDLVRYLAIHKSPGDQVVLTILRGDQKMDLTVTLGARP